MTLGAVRDRVGLPPKAILVDNNDCRILLDLSMRALSGCNVAMFTRRYEKHSIPIVLYSSRTIEKLEEADITLDSRVVSDEFGNRCR
jgi:CheY-like chemotaxis protein